MVAGASDDERGEPAAAAMAAAVRDRALRWFPDLATACVRVEPLGLQRRTGTCLYRFRISADGAAPRVVVAKVSRPRPVLPCPPRPKLFPPTGGDKHGYEYVALCEVAKHFEALGDPRLGYVRVLDHLADFGALVMEEVSHPTLRQLFAQAAARHLVAPPASLRAAVRHAGAWLREFHGLGAAGAVVLRPRRDDVLAALGVQAAHVAAAAGDPFLPRRLLPVAERIGEATLPAELPLALSHGDFASRNVFVEPDGRVAGFDMLARWRSPVYEDVAFFIVSLRASRFQVLTQGLASGPSRLAVYEQEFLRGYFGEDLPPLGAVRLFELLIVLDKWSATLSRDRGVSPRAGARRLPSPLVNRFYRMTAERLAQRACV